MYTMILLLFKILAEITKSRFPTEKRFITLSPGMACVYQLIEFKLGLQRVRLGPSIPSKVSRKAILPSSSLFGFTLAVIAISIS